MVVCASTAGRLNRIIKLASSVRKGGVVASILVGDQSIAVHSPGDGVVARQQVKENTVVELNQPIVTLTVGTGVMHYVAALRRIPSLNPVFERARPRDRTHRESKPDRFALAIGVNGVLTARIALHACTLTPSGKPPEEDGQLTPAGAARQASSGDADGPGSMPVRIAALSISGVTEHVDPFGVSARAVFRSLNQEAYAALEILRNRAASSGRQGTDGAVCGEGDVLLGLGTWLSSYRTLFTSKCVYCSKILSEETSATAGTHSYVPPTGRSLGSGVAYHPWCKPLHLADAMA